MITDKQKKFCREYIIDFNATQAAIRAGYSKRTATPQGARLLSKVNIQKYTAKLSKEAAEKSELTVQSVLADIAKVKKRCFQDQPVLNRQGKKTGLYKFNAQGALKACELEGRFLKMFTDKFQHSGVDGKPHEIKFVVEFVKPEKKKD